MVSPKQQLIHTDLLVLVRLCFLLVALLLLQKAEIEQKEKYIMQKYGIKVILSVT